MDTVRFVIHRRPSLLGALLPYKIYINGSYVGSFSNGKTLIVNIPSAQAYLIEVGQCLGSNFVVPTGECEYKIELQRASDGQHGSRTEMYLVKDEQRTLLPSFHFDKYTKSVYSNTITQLAPAEQTLAYCMKFWLAATDDLQEVYASPNYHLMLDALCKIGASGAADLLEHLAEEHLPDAVLPLDDDQIELYAKNIEKANQAFWKDGAAISEFHKGVVSFVLKNLNNAANVY